MTFFSRAGFDDLLDRGADRLAADGFEWAVMLGILTLASGGMVIFGEIVWFFATRGGG